MTFLAVLTRIGDLLKCPVCLQHFKPPVRIVSCQLGHNVCLTCVQYLNDLEQSGDGGIKCPVCRDARVKVDNFNWFAENICDVLFTAGVFGNPAMHLEHPITLVDDIRGRSTPGNTRFTFFPYFLLFYFFRSTSRKSRQSYCWPIRAIIGFKNEYVICISCI